MITKTSIIVVAYDKSHIRRQITAACLGNIERYTDTEDYELIVIDQEPCEIFDSERERFGAFTNFKFSTIDKYIVLDKHIGLSVANNLGASKATGEYICFLHNDVFVSNDWLPRLRYFLENNFYDIVVPHQGTTPRKKIKEWTLKNPEDFNGESGYYDAGLLLMRKKDFDKTGGWDEDFKFIYSGNVFVRYICQDKYKLRLQCTPAVIITHLGQFFDIRQPYPKRYAEAIKKENRLLHEKGYIK